MEGQNSVGKTLSSATPRLASRSHADISYKRIDIPYELVSCSPHNPSWALFTTWTMNRQSIFPTSQISWHLHFTFEFIPTALCTALLEPFCLPLIRELKPSLPQILTFCMPVKLSSCGWWQSLLSVEAVARHTPATPNHSSSYLWVPE